MHDYSVAFRIYSESELFDLEEITKNLGITPTDTRKLGEKKYLSKPWSQSMWGYSLSPGNSSENWNSLEDGLTSLLKIFMPLKQKIDEYAEKYNVVLWCGHFSSSFDGGPTLSPEMLKKLGDFGVELFLDTYTRIDDQRY